MISNDRDDSTYPIVIHLRYLGRLLKERDPDGVYSEIGRSNYRSHYRLPPIEYWGCGRCIDWYCNDVGYDEVVRFPKYGGAEEEGTCDGRVGSVMVREQSRCRSFLVRMGYLSEEMLYDEVSLQSVGPDIFKDLLEGEYSPVKVYTVLNVIPPWYALLRKSL
jgi:hypothetical protein